MNKDSMTKTVLIADDEQDFRILAENFLKVYTDKVNVLVASNGRQALEILSTRKVDVLVTDIKMPEMDGIELLTHLSRKNLDIYVIVITGFATKENLKRLNQVGQYYYMAKPISMEHFGKKITSVLQDNSKVKDDQFTVSNLLQLINMEQKTCTLSVKSNGKVGYLYLRNGELINAETDGIDGQEAAKMIISWPQAETEIQGTRRKERKIQANLMSILLEATRFADENRASRFHTDLLEKAVRFAEGHYFREAKEALTRLLKLDRRNVKGWLWYSRIVDNLKALQMSLANAARIAPQDPEVAAEIKTFKLAKENLNGKHFLRCPFCWFPFEEGTDRCPNCTGHLSINGWLLKSTPVAVASQIILKKAVDRYTRVIGRDKNAKAHFFLGLAHLNLQNWEDALTHIDKSAKLEPMERFYSFQLQTLLNHMASAKTPSAGDLLSVQKKPDPSQTAPEVIVKRKKVLVVEDSTTTRKVISIALSQNGYEIIEAGDGLEALSKLNEATPDLIILDIILPIMDGYKILSIIKENSEFEKIPVIMLTSKDGIISKVKGKVAGTAAYLTKPFDPAQLVETIERHIN